MRGRPAVGTDRGNRKNLLISNRMFRFNPSLVSRLMVMIPAAEDRNRCYTRSMTRVVLLAPLLVFLAILGCATEQAPATPDIPATVIAAVVAALPGTEVALTPDIEATVQSRLQTKVAGLPTPTLPPLPTELPTPTATPTLEPTPVPATPTRIPTSVEGTDRFQ